MDQSEKRQIENELTVMGLPGLADPALLQVMADVVNGSSPMAERVDFFCEMLNETQGVARREMYEAMRPRLHFAVPSLDECEVRIAAKAERKIRPKGLPGERPEEPQEEIFVDVTCGCCERVEMFVGVSVREARYSARSAGWGRGSEVGTIWCPECRLTAMPVRVFGKSHLGDTSR